MFIVIFVCRFKRRQSSPCELQHEWHLCERREDWCDASELICTSTLTCPRCRQRQASRPQSRRPRVPVPQEEDWCICIAHIPRKPLISSLKLPRSCSTTACASLTSPRPKRRCTPSTTSSVRWAGWHHSSDAPTRMIFITAVPAARCGWPPRSRRVAGLRPKSSRSDVSTAPAYDTAIDVP